MESGEAFSLTSRYCENHGAFTLTVVYPERFDQSFAAFTRLDDVLPPLFSEPPKFLFVLLRALWEEARDAVRSELTGCVALP